MAGPERRCHAVRVDGPPTSAEDPGPSNVTTEPRPWADGDGHRLSVFMFADIRGYTDFTATNGADAASELVARFTQAVTETVGANGGRGSRDLG